MNKSIPVEEVLFYPDEDYFDLELILDLRKKRVAEMFIAWHRINNLPPDRSLVYVLWINPDNPAEAKLHRTTEATYELFLRDYFRLPDDFIAPLINVLEHSTGSMDT